MAKFFHGRNSVQGATGLLVVTLTLSNILGLFRDRLLAAHIPASSLDSYFAAFRLPDLLTSLIVIGALSVVFIPIFTEIREKNEEEAWQAANAILTVMTALLVVGSAFLWLCMPSLMRFVVPDFDSQKMTETVFLARALTLTPIFFGVSYLVSGIVNSFHRFTVYALAPLVYNLSIILGIMFFSDRFGVRGVIFGVVIGSFLHMLIQLPVAAKLGWRWRPTLKFDHPAVKRIGSLLGPRILGLASMQVAAIVATALASSWAGAIAFYNLANNIQTMPTAIFGASIATALFPTLSQKAALQADGEFRKHLTQGIRWICFLLIPASLALILLRIQLVRLILGAGHFDWVATETTADVLGWFALSLVASGLIPLLARAFYACQDVRTPMTFALIASVVIIGLSYLLTATLPEMIALNPSHTIHVGQVAALAIAFSVGVTIQAFLLLNAARKHFGLRYSEIVASLGKIILATICMGVAMQLTKTITGSLADLSHFTGVLLQTVLAVFFGGVSYLLAVAVLECSEWHELTALVKRKISTATSTDSA